MIEMRLLPCQKKNSFPEVLFRRQTGLSDKQRRHADCWDFLKNWLTSKNGPTLELISRRSGNSSRNGLLYDSQKLVFRTTERDRRKTSYNTIHLNTSHHDSRVSFKIPAEVKDIEFARGPVSAGDSDISSSLYRSCLYCLSASSIYVFNVDNGMLVDQALLSEHSVCTEFHVDHETHSIYVKTLKKPSLDKDLLTSFFALQYHPLKVIGRLEIRYSTYGKTLMEAEVNQGLLLTMHQKDVIRIYNVSMAMNGDCVPLFHVQSYQHQFYIGGNPYCFITVVDHSKFHVHLLENNQVIKKGLLETSCLSIDSHVSFHPDDSSRLLVISKCSLRTYAIQRTETEFQLIHLATYNRGGVADGVVRKTAPQTTMSGRKIQRRIPVNHDFLEDTDDSTQLAWDYEDELDLMGIVYAEYEQHRQCRLLHLDLIDGRTGKILRRVNLEESFTTGLNIFSVGLRLDASNVIITFSGKGKTELLVYRFTVNDVING